MGSFGKIWAGDSVPGRIWRTLNFGVLQVKKFKFRSVENMGIDVEMAPHLRKYNYFGLYSV